MKQFAGFILGMLLALTVVGCAALTTAPQLISSGLSLYQSAKQISGIAQSLSASSVSCDQTVAEKMDGYAKWADTIAKAAAEIEAGAKKKE